MNTENFTNFLCSLGLLLSLSSCNIIQAIGGGETKIGNNFRGGPKPYKVFFESSSGVPHVLDTAHGRIVTMNGSVSASGEFKFFDGHIFYKATDATANLYKYDPNSETSTLVISGNGPTGLETFYGRLYYVRSDGLICYLESSSDTQETCGTNAYLTMDWLKSSHTDNLLYGCSNGSLQIVTANGEASAIDPDGALTDVPCGSGKPWYSDGKFVNIGASNLGVFDIPSNSYSEVTGLGSIIGITLSHSGNLYFAEGSSLKRFSIYDQSIHDLNISSIPGNIIETPEDILFTNYDGVSGDEIYRLPNESTSGPEQISSFGGLSALYLAVGPEAFYMIHSGGVEKIYHDGGTENIFNATVNQVLGEMHTR